MLSHLVCYCQIFYFWISFYPSQDTLMLVAFIGQYSFIFTHTFTLSKVANYTWIFLFPSEIIFFFFHCFVNELSQILFVQEWFISANTEFQLGTLNMLFHWCIFTSICWEVIIHLYFFSLKITCALVFLATLNIISVSWFSVCWLSCA